MRNYLSFDNGKQSGYTTDTKPIKCLDTLSGETCIYDPDNENVKAKLASGQLVRCDN